DAEPVGRELREALRAVVFVHEPVDGHRDLLIQHGQDADLAVGAVEDFLAVAVDALALVVHYLVVFEQVLTDVEVALLDLLLGALDPSRHHAALDGLALFHAQAGQHVGDPLAGEDAHQVVLERQVEAAAAGVALAAGAAAELVVDAAGFMPPGADHVPPPPRRPPAAPLPPRLPGFDLPDDPLPLPPPPPPPLASLSP